MEKLLLALALIVLVSGCAKSSNDTNQVNNNQNVCNPDWKCSEWSACLNSNTQTRTCSDTNSCNTSAGKPSETQNCEYTPGVGDTSAKNDYSVKLMTFSKSGGTEAYARIECKVQTTNSTGFNAVNDVCSEIVDGSTVYKTLFKSISGIGAVISATYTFDFAKEITDINYPVDIKIYVGTGIASFCSSGLVVNATSSSLPADLKIFTFRAVPKQFQ